MGLDLALGAMVLIGALRGWFKGFVSQAIRIASFVACFYLADPVRDQARPYVLAKLPAIDPALMDRIVWWVSVVVSYVILVGLATLAIKLTRSPQPPESPKSPGVPISRRDNQFGGMILGTAKALLFAAIIAAGVHKYADEFVGNAPWAQRQLVGSHALSWTATYRPIPRLWATEPVQQFVAHIQLNGLRDRSEGEGEKKLAERAAVEEGAVGSPPRLELTPEREPSPEQTPAGDPELNELAREIEEIKSQLESRQTP
jgi:uncharacterized membrane protein required for colicin V production